MGSTIVSNQKVKFEIEIMKAAAIIEAIVVADCFLTYMFYLEDIFLTNII